MAPVTRPAAPRIPPLGEDERDEAVQALLDEFVFGTTVNVYATMARHPDVLARCVRLGGELRRGSLTVRERELLILRTGWLCQSPYEFAQHADLARAAGVTEEELDRIVDGPDAPGWEQDEATLLRAADELHETSSVSDGTWSNLVARYDERQLIEVVMFCGYYHLISFFLNSLGVPLEEGKEPFRRFASG
ncbi:MAG TPA: carboxymuconolactone decarboxylase family protein [Acidimicrobiales bacterium]|nr:carboxymuconolactone decarboxylase family protein [Acidimicrobiales bacterium]